MVLAAGLFINISDIEVKENTGIVRCFANDSRVRKMIESEDKEKMH